MASVGSFSGISSGIQWRDMVDQIMQLEMQRKLAPVSRRISVQGQRKDAWNSFNTLLSNVSAATKDLRDGTGFAAFSVSASDSSVLSASASSTAAPGSYSIDVSQLATQDKVASATAFASLTDAQGLAGTFQVNNRSVEIEAGDTLSNIRDKINTANTGTNPSGVSASIVQVSDTDYRLVLTAENTGSRGIELVDSARTGGGLQSLGVLDGSYAANTRTETNPDASTTTYNESQRFSDTTTTVAQMLGLTSPPNTANVMVDGVKVQIDLQNDNLQEVLDNIQNALRTAGRSEAVIDSVKINTETVGSQTMHRLSTPLSVEPELDGGGLPVGDTLRTLELLGFQKGGFADAKQTGQDAKLAIDGFEITRRTNNVSDALSGLTLTLKDAGSSTLTVGRNLDAVAKNVQNLADAYNEIVAFQKKQMTADAPLRANGSLRTAVNSLKNTLLNNVEGIDPATTEFTRLGAAGVALTKDGTLEVDSAKLKEALTNNFDEVAKLFGTSAVATNNDVSFIADSRNTVAGTYAIEITQAADVARAVGTGWNGTYTDDGTNANRMTVTSGSRSVTVDLTLFNTADLLQAELDRQFTEQGIDAKATTDGTNISIDGTQYGTSASFTVAYSREADDGTITEGLASPIGLAADTYTGVNVAGTIGGHAATGSGRTLTGTDGTAVEGLVIRYAGTATGPAGDITYTAGAAGAIDKIAQAYTDPIDGMIKQTLSAIDESTTSLRRREDNVIDRLERYEESLIKRFVAMESAMSVFQSQGNWLASQITSMQAAGSNR